MTLFKYDWFLKASHIVSDEAKGGVSVEKAFESKPSEPPKSSKRGWRWLLAILIVIPIVLFGVVVSMIQTEAGTKALWSSLKFISAGKLQADWNSGSLAHGGSASKITVHVAKYVDVDLINVSGEWSWDYLPLKWKVNHLAVGTVNVTMYPKPVDNTPLDSVTLPLAIDVKQLQVKTVNLIQGLDTTTLTDVDGAVATDKRHHTINLTHMTQGVAEYNGEMQIDGMRPFVLKGNLQASSKYDGNNYVLNMKTDGDLYHLNLDLDAKGGTEAQPLNGVGRLEVQLLDRYYIHQGHVSITHLNPFAFWDKLPKADLDIALEATPQASNNTLVEVGNKSKEHRQPVHGNWKIVNHAAGSLSDFSIPIMQMTGDFDLTRDQQNIRNIDIIVSNNGHITGSGVTKAQKGEFTFDVQDFDLKNVHPQLLSTRLSGPLALTVTKSDQHIVSTLTNRGSNALQLFADVDINNERVDITQAHISGSANAKIELKGQLKYSEGLPFVGKAQLSQFNLAEIGSFPSTRLAGNFDIDGAIKPEVKVNVKGQLNNSVWAGVPAQGKVDVSYNAPDKVIAREFDVTVGVNKFFAKGSLGISNDSHDKLNVDINAPNLSQLQFGTSGSLVAKADLSGSMMKPRGVIDATAKDLKVGSQSIQEAQIKGEWNGSTQGAMNGKLNLLGYDNGLVKLDSVNVDINGTQAAHRFNVQVKGHVLILKGESGTDIKKGDQVFKVEGKPAVQWILDATSQGTGRITDTGWQGQINQLVNKGQPNVVLQHAAQISFEKGELQFKNLDAQVQNAQLNLDSLDIMGERINSRGHVSNLLIPEWLTWLDISFPFYTDMSIKGDWDMAMGNAPSGGFKFEREKGDISLDKHQKNLIALSQLALSGRMVGRNLAITGNLNSDRLGKVDINGNVGLVSTSSGWVVSAISPLNLSAKAQMDDLKQFNTMLGANIRLNGNLQADLHIGGVLGAPTKSGVITGDNLDFSHIEQGFRLKNGKMRLNLTDTTIDFEQFDFDGVEGKLSVRGQVSYGAGGRLLTAEVTMVKLRPFVQVDRQLVLSGKAELGYDGSRQLQIRGKVRADKAVIDMPETLAPSLGDDVVVCSNDPKKSHKCNVNNGKFEAQNQLEIVPSIDLNLDLGDDFYFKGQGADVKLAGNVQLTNVDGADLRAKGVVRVEDGKYKFYGQNLKVQRGYITFQGPMDDPALNLLANRTVDGTEVGVELTGTLANSKARLVSNPEMPDEEKLSWLLFGRPASKLSSSDNSAIAGAAAILLGSEQGRKITEKLGIDSFNFGSSDNGLTGTVVGVGKRLNDKFSVAYEQGLDSIAGVVKVTWSLSRSWQLILRGGSINGADIQYTHRFDKLF